MHSKMTTCSSQTSKTKITLVRATGIPACRLTNVLYAHIRWVFRCFQDHDSLKIVPPNAGFHTPFARALALKNWILNAKYAHHPFAVVVNILPYASLYAQTIQTQTIHASVSLYHA